MEELWLSTKKVALALMALFLIIYSITLGLFVFYVLVLFLAQITKSIF